MKMGLYRGDNQFSLDIEENELIVDNFAGGGGASTGLEMALGRPVDIAINHDPDAIAMHKTNHPLTKHYLESVWDVDPREVCKGRPVGIAWFSPDCKHFSKAAGGKPLDKQIRGLAWVTLRWGVLTKPRQIYLENVEEFTSWGPLVNGKPCQEKKGKIFDGFVKALSTGMGVKHDAYTDVYHSLFRCNYDLSYKLAAYKALKHGLGYKVEWKTLIASEQGCPTTRKRFFLVARCDGKPIVWPQATHGNPNKKGFDSGLLKPWKTAADIIDWSIPCKSIFNRKKPLADKSLLRIFKGVVKFVIDNPNPFIAPDNAVITPFITEYANASNQRNMSANEPLRTICAQVKGGHFALVSPKLEKVSNLDKEQQNLIASFMVKYRGKNVGFKTDEPMHTITAGGNHIGEVRCFLVKYYGTATGQDLNEPLHTIRTGDCFGLVMVKGDLYQIVDIGLRMLEPHELFAAQSFPNDYIINIDYTGKKYSKAKQVARCGNSVPPLLAAALVAANNQGAEPLREVA